MAPALRLLGRKQLTPGADQTCESDREPGDQEAAIRPRELAVEAERDEWKRSEGGPGKRRLRKAGVDRCDDRGETGHAEREESGPAKEGAGGGSRKPAGVCR